MNTPGNSDERFHENLQVLGGRIPVPESPSDEVRSRCMGEFRVPARSSGRSGLRKFRRPAVLSALGLAACLVLFVGFLFPTSGGPTVEAAVILAKLNEQIADPQLIELKIDSITIEEASIDGQIQVAKEGIAGDVRVVVNEADEQPIKVDASFGISQDGGWVLVRELGTSDPEVQPVIDLLLPPGTETLLLLPADVDLPGLELDIAEGVSELSTAHKMIETFTEIVRSQPDTDATVTEQRDGTILLTLPIPDAEALQNLARMAAMAADEELKREGKESDIDLDEIDVDVDDDDLNDLFGSTLHVVYDPGTKLVRRFAITDFGKNKGSLSVELSDGKIDTALLDASRVTGPNTRTIDLSAFQKLIDKVGG
ncbi:MAG: hypothetical protein JSU86_14935, partial [Phycisphaerales bacterium]